MSPDTPAGTRVRRPGGIYVWQPTPKPKGRPKIRRTWDEVRIWAGEGLIACPTCGAKTSESCRTRTGHTTYAHKDRLVPRTCPCGADLPKHRKLCDPCRDASYATSQIEHLRRRRAKQKGAAA